MAVSKAQQKAQNKWIAKAYDRVNLTLPKGQKEIVQSHAAALGESVNGFIGRAISETMKRGRQDSPGNRRKGRRIDAGSQAPETLKAVQEAAGTGIQPAHVDKVKAAEKLFSILGDLGMVDLDMARCERLGIMYLSLDTLEAAQRAAERTGETIAAFVARAVADQEKSDDRSFQMGINPA